MFNLRALFNYDGNSTLGTFCSISTMIETRVLSLTIFGQKKEEEQKTTQRELKLSFLQLQ